MNQMRSDCERGEADVLAGLMKWCLKHALQGVDQRERKIQPERVFRGRLPGQIFVMRNKLAHAGELSSINTSTPAIDRRSSTLTYVLLGTLGLMVTAVAPLARIQIEFGLALTGLVAVGLAGFSWYLTHMINAADERASHLGTQEQNRRELTVLTLALSEAIEGITRLDANGRFAFVNRAYAESIGYTPEDIIGRDWRMTIQPENHRHIRAAFVDMMKSGKAQTTVMGRHRDGATIYGELTMVPFRDERGQYAGHYGFTRNITERKNAEMALAVLHRRNEMILNSVGEGILGLDIKGTITSVNTAAAGLLGYEVEHLLGRKMHQTMHSAHVDGKPYEVRQCPIQATLNQGVFQTRDGEVFTRSDGTPIPVDYMSNPMFDETGEVMGAVVAFRDMTDRYELDRIKSEFVSTVSHELRTPLTSIRGSLGLLASGRLGEVTDKGHRMLDIAVANTDRLIRLINDILDIERLESGKVTLVRKRVYVSELLDNTMELLRDLADRAGVRLQNEAIRGAIWADHDRITQTLTNLLSNAIKFSPRGSTVTVAGTQQGDYLQFEVRDQGRGVPPEKLETIFDRFQQVDSSDAREKGGTGLGLAICRSIVQQHGGRIWAESRVGEGSTFYFTVSLAEPSDAQSSLNAAAAVSRAPVPKILIVEDDGDLARVIAASFEKYEALIYRAATGSQAIELATTVQPDLLVLDLVLPEMDGFSIVKWLRKDELMRHVPVIVFSAAEVTPEQKKLLMLGPTEFVTKSRHAPEEFDCKATSLLKNFTARGTENHDANSAH